MGSCIQALTWALTTATTTTTTMADVETSPAPEPVTEVTESTESLTVEEVSNEVAVEEPRPRESKLKLLQRRRRQQRRWMLRNLQWRRAQRRLPLRWRPSQKKLPLRRVRLSARMLQLRPRLRRPQRPPLLQNNLKFSITSFIYLEFILVCRLVQ